MKRLNIRTILVFAFAVRLATMLLNISQDVQKLEHEKKALQNDIQEHAETLHTLRAEWTYLTSPHVLENLIQQTPDTPKAMPHVEVIMQPEHINALFLAPNNAQDDYYMPISTGSYPQIKPSTGE